MTKKKKIIIACSVTAAAAVIAAVIIAVVLGKGTDKTGKSGNAAEIAAELSAGDYAGAYEAALSDSDKALVINENLLAKYTGFIMKQFNKTSLTVSGAWVDSVYDRIVIHVDDVYFIFLKGEDGEYTYLGAYRGEFDDSSESTTASSAQSVWQGIIAENEGLKYSNLIRTVAQGGDTIPAVSVNRVNKLISDGLIDYDKIELLSK